MALQVFAYDQLQPGTKVRAINKLDYLPELKTLLQEITTDSCTHFIIQSDRPVKVELRPMVSNPAEATSETKIEELIRDLQASSSITEIPAAEIGSRHTYIVSGQPFLTKKFSKSVGVEAVSEFIEIDASPLRNRWSFTDTSIKVSNGLADEYDIDASYSVSAKPSWLQPKQGGGTVYVPAKVLFERGSVELRNKRLVALEPAILIVFSAIFAIGLSALVELMVSRVK